MTSLVVFPDDMLPPPFFFVRDLGPPPSPSGHRCATPLPFAARDLCRQRIQLRLPQAPELTDPRIHRLEPRSIHRIEMPLCLRPDPPKAALAQHLEVLRHCRLRDPELGPDRLDHLSRRHFPMTEQLENATAHRIGQDFEDVHQLPVPGCATPGGLSPR